MEWALIAVVGLGGLFWLVSTRLIESSREQQQSDPDGVLDGWFDGRDQVMVEQGPTTLDQQTIVDGANRRGYRLTSTEQMAYPHNSKQRMVFDRG